MTDTKLAVVPFTLVAHNDVPVDSLSLDDVPNVCDFDSGRTGSSCGFASTEELLHQVADKMNTVGYADLYDAEQLAGQLKLIRIDNREPVLDDIRHGYPFWAVEYLYSADNLAAGSLASAFSTYLRGADGGKIMSRYDCIPCAEVSDLCNRR